ncbi:hypothetical protein GVAV_000300 [Gurleya vavrai]
MFLFFVIKIFTTESDHTKIHFCDDIIKETIAIYEKKIEDERKTYEKMRYSDVLFFKFDTYNELVYNYFDKTLTDILDLYYSITKKNIFDLYLLPNKKNSTNVADFYKKCCKLYIENKEKNEGDIFENNDLKLYYQQGVISELLTNESLNQNNIIFITNSLNEENDFGFLCRSHLRYLKKNFDHQCKYIFLVTSFENAAQKIEWNKQCNRKIFVEYYNKYLFKNFTINNFELNTNFDKHTDDTKQYIHKYYYFGCEKSDIFGISRIDFIADPLKSDLYIGNTINSTLKINVYESDTKNLNNVEIADLDFKKKIEIKFEFCGAKFAITVTLKTRKFYVNESVSYQDLIILSIRHKKMDLYLSDMKENKDFEFLSLETDCYLPELKPENCAKELYNQIERIKILLNKNFLSI